MFLTQEPHTIEDFLKSVNFITPQGMNLKYFIVPLNGVNDAFTAVSTEAGYSPEQELNVPGVTDTITYTKRQAVNKNALGTSNFDPSAKPEIYPTHIEPVRNVTPEDDIVKHGGRVQSGASIYDTPDIAAEVLESVNRKDGLVRKILKESVGCFPKNTLLCFNEVK